MSAWNICRFCDKHDHDDALVKYAVRHYAHGPCLATHRGVEAIASLHAWQIAQLPVLLMRKAGVSPEKLEELYAAAVAREARR